MCHFPAFPADQRCLFALLRMITSISGYFLLSDFFDSEVHAARNLPERSRRLSRAGTLQDFCVFDDLSRRSFLIRSGKYIKYWPEIINKTLAEKLSELAANSRWILNTDPKIMIMLPSLFPLKPPEVQGKLDPRHLIRAQTGINGFP